MSRKSKSSEPKKPLRRVDLHRTPEQGKQPYRGPAHHRHPDESPPFSPYRGLPAVMDPYGHTGGASGFAMTESHAVGPYFGVGPRNYAKPDQRVLDDVCELLTRHGELDVRSVDVHCHNGVIRLEGHVPTRWMRREIEAAAESVFGVEDVENHLAVEPTAQTPHE